MNTFSVRVLLLPLSLWIVSTEAFSTVPPRLSGATRLAASTQEDAATTTPTRPKVQELGLLTFDLDDTLYPIAPVLDAANGEFEGEKEMVALRDSHCPVLCRRFSH